MLACARYNCCGLQRLLRDYRTLENAIGGRLNQAPPRLIQGWSPTAQLRAYRFFMERGYLDDLLDGWIVRPFQKSFQLFDRWERGWTDWLSGKQSRELDAIVPKWKLPRTSYD